ncbi:MAG: septal ring lytic transglycosylase RlpA family protein [Acidobacteria bacterium]|nr:septal ring lytic transglycosylase RlpA family protein [Acidobacteriota bacterium]
MNEWLDRENVFENGIATWYGRRFHGRRTANGEKFDMHKLTAAHKTLPFHTLVEVENLDNGKRVIVRINDRGPFRNNRIIDLSYNAAKKLDCCKDGVVPVVLRIVKPGEVSISGTEIALLTNPGQANELPGKKVPEIKANEIIAKKEETKKTGVSQVSEQAKFYLQAGAFSEKVNAQKMLENMKANVADVTFDIYFQNGMYKVISAPQSSRARAEELKKALQTFKIDVFIKEQI